jgi:CheY-like chemotaxis protein
MRTLLLVVEDGPFRQSIKTGLAAHGFDVRDAADGLAALDAVRAAAPDCVITEILLPKIDGYRLVR